MGREAWAPGKLILFGEHAVAYGHPALGCALSRGVRARLTAGTGEVVSHLAVGAATIPGHGATDLVHAALGREAGVTDAEITLELPPGAGLGTSAALAIAVLRAAAGSAPSTTQLLHDAVRVEDLAHGVSSGLDPAIVLSEGLITFTRHPDGRRDFAPIRLAAPIHLVVGVFGAHGGTKARVAGVAALRLRAERAIDAGLATLGEASRLGTVALCRGDFELAGRAMDLAHGVLAGLGLVGGEIEDRVRIARRAGALGAKMSGAGGNGGAFYALAPTAAAAEPIAVALRHSGALAWVETLPRVS